MKKIARLSLVAAVAVAGLSTSAMADSLADAFAKSKVKGEIKSLYFQKEKETGADAKSSIWSNGGNLSLTTGSYYGLKAGVTFQTAHVTAIDDDANNYKKDMNASGSVMSQAYLAYSLGNTTAKVGRQYIKTPLVAGSGSRIFKQSFEGVVLFNTDIPDTTLVAAYVDKYQNRTAYAGDSTEPIGDEPQFEQVADGAYTVYVKNKSIPNLAIQAQYAQVNALAGSEDTKHFYADATYKLNPITISAQTYQTDNGAATDSDGTAYGIKVAAKMAGFNVAAAYTTIDDEAKVLAGLGSGADKLYSGAPIVGGVYDADTDAYRLDLGYKFSNGLGLATSYSNWETGSADDVSETNLTVSYKMNKNLSTKIMYSSYDNYSYDYRSRVYLSYKF